MRWKSDEALLIYARLNDSERTSWIGKARQAVVDSKVAAFLPTVDGALIAAEKLRRRRVLCAAAVSPHRRDGPESDCRHRA